MAMETTNYFSNPQSPYQLQNQEPLLLIPAFAPIDKIKQLGCSLRN